MNTIDPADNDLTSTLAREAERFSNSHHADLSMDRVMNRAGEIRRGRRMRATMVMAAVVLAIAVPVGVTVLNDGGVTSGHKPPVATNGPAEPDHSPLTLDGLKTGDDPKIAYAYAGILYGARDGGTEPLGKGGNPTYLTHIDGGWIVGRSGGSATTASFISDDRNSDIDENWRIDGGFATNPAGNIGALVTTDGTVIAIQDEGTRWFEVGTLPSGSGFNVDAVSGSSCTDRSEEPGCTVYVSGYADDKTQVWAVQPHVAPRVVDNFFTVKVSPRNGDLAGMVSASDDGSCSEVRSISGGLKFKTCDYSFAGFSPDGRYILGVPAYLDGPGVGFLALLDAESGKVEWQLNTKNQAVVPQWAWEDETHLLTVIQQGNEYGMVRISIDGNRELALPTATDNGDYVSPFLLAGL